jgi:hypothetical protein
MRATLLGLISVSIVVTASGCLAVALGGGAVGAAYVLGDIDRTYPFPLEIVWSATETALAELQLPPGFDSKDQLTAQFDRRTATGDRIRITLASRGQFTKLSLRVNTFGDRSMSQVIVGRIESHLPAAPYASGLPQASASTAEADRATGNDGFESSVTANPGPSLEP